MIGNDYVLRSMAKTYREQAKMLRATDSVGADTSDMVVDLIDEVIALRARLLQLGDPLASVLEIRADEREIKR